ncbi:reverse transcriptase domain-containing protein [Tanacetum coccineum]
MSGSDKVLEIIQEVDTQTSEYTSKEHNKVGTNKVEPQNVRVLICISARIPQAPDRYGYYVEVEEYEILVELPPNGRIVRSKWIFKKRTDMDGNVYTVKARLNTRFDEEIHKIGFTQNPDEPCVYLKSSGSNVVFLVLYVDDILLMGNSVAMLQEVKSWLCKYSYMKDLGEAAYILGIKIIHDRSKRLIALSQSAYLEKTLKKFKMENSKKRFNHVFAVKTILKYLRNTKDMVLVYGAKPEDELKVSCYANAKAEYIATAEALMKAVWMRKFIDGLGGVMPSNKRHMKMLCDKEPTLAIAGDPKISKGAKHFQRKYHYIREVIQQGEIVLKKVYTNGNVADPFTKQMPFNKHFEHPMGIGIKWGVFSLRD